eukprot:g45050.t1
MCRAVAEFNLDKCEVLHFGVANQGRTYTLNGKVPSDWKIANMTPQFKKGGTQKTRNYKPVQELPTYVLDTTHALHLFQHFQFPGRQHLNFTIDIQSLYTFILKALLFFLSHRLNQSPSTDTLNHLTELVLTLNNFSFNSFHFLQTKGVAMSTR